MTRPDNRIITRFTAFLIIFAALMSGFMLSVLSKPQILNHIIGLGLLVIFVIGLFVLGALALFSEFLKIYHGESFFRYLKQASIGTLGGFIVAIMIPIARQDLSLLEFAVQGAARFLMVIIYIVIFGWIYFGIEKWENEYLDRTETE